MGKDSRRFATRAVHDGAQSDRHGGASTVPIYQSSAFAYDTAEALAEVFAGRKPGYIYSRLGNPTVTAAEQRLCSLEGGVGAVATSSGMAAVSTVVLSLASAGSEVVFHSSLFGGTVALLESTIARGGVVVRFADLCEAGAAEAVMSDKTRLVFVEAIGNPKLDVPDLAALSRVCRSHGVPLVVDGTLATPYLWDAKALGVDVVVHSATKYLTGNGSAIGGFICDMGTFDWKGHPDAGVRAAAERFGGGLAFIATARATISNVGGCASPFDCYLHLLGMETLSLRMEQHCANARALARHLESHAEVQSVAYPALEGSPSLPLATSQFGGRGGGLVTARLGTQDRCFRMINALSLTTQLANLGDSKTLIIHPASTIYRTLAPERRAAAGAHDDLVRIAVGIEHPDDIIADFDQALRAV